MTIFDELDINRFSDSPSAQATYYSTSTQELALQDLLLWLGQRGVHPSQVTLDVDGETLWIYWSAEDDS